MELSDLTIIVPTKNEAHNIGRFLQSVPRNVKLIVVDSSTDGTAGRALSLRPHATRVLKVQAPIALARQLGGQAATTPWLLFTDADVTFDDHYFNNMRRYRACDAIYGPKHANDDFAAYHTDVPGFSRLWGLGALYSPAVGYFRWLHNQATLNLCPSHATFRELQTQGYKRLNVWGRGVDSERFHPARRTDDWRRRLSGGRERKTAAAKCRAPVAGETR